MLDRDSSRPRVLVIDDSIESANGLRQLLQLEGYDARAEYDAAQALETARNFAPDIVLCDLALPEIDGFEVARRLRADPELARATLVALTGNDDAAKSVAAGFDAHFTKPIMVDELIGVLARLAARP